MSVVSETTYTKNKNRCQATVVKFKILMGYHFFFQICFFFVLSVRNPQRTSSTRTSP